MLAYIKRKNTEKGCKENEYKGSEGKFYTMIGKVNKSKNGQILIDFYAPQYIKEHYGNVEYEKLECQLEQYGSEGFSETVFSEKANEIFGEIDDEINIFKYKLMSNDKIEEKTREIFKR